MRLHALLALPALLSAFVVAVPSPASYLSEASPEDLTLASFERPQSRWRTLSNHLAYLVWGSEKTAISNKLQQKDYTDRQLPPPTLARYSGDVVLRFNISTEDEANSLAYVADTLLLDVWRFSHHWVDIRLAKETVPLVLGLVPTTLQKSHAALLNERDLAQAIFDTYPQHRHRTSPLQITAAPSLFSPAIRQPSLSTTDGDDTNIFFSDYQPLRVIEPWFRLLASLFTTHVRLINIGLSYEGRDILALRVGNHPTNNDDPDAPKRKTVVITGGSHAREWISTSTVNFLAYSLITAYGKDADVTDLFEAYDFVFIPTLNPDGYEYTWTTDRLWRKNRQPTSIRWCPGIDLDRGFGFEWSVAAAHNPCSENFAGTSPFEAVESRRLADWAKNETENNNVEIVAFLDLHSYSQQILYPYSFSCAATPPSQENLEELAVGLEKSIRRSSGVSYEVMSACAGNVFTSKRERKRTLLPLIEAQGGSALDYFYHELHVKYAYQIKLRDRGTYGFLLPKENIVPVGKEILEAVMYMGAFLKDGYPKLDVSEEVGMEERGDEDEPRDDGGETEDEEEVGDEWVLVEDLGLSDEEAKWDLRRRRRR